MCLQVQALPEHRVPLVRLCCSPNLYDRAGKARKVKAALGQVSSPVTYTWLHAKALVNLLGAHWLSSTSLQQQQQ
jgi:hypothetical protein